MKRKAPLFIALLLLIPATTFAQGWEITPFVGYKSGGNLEVVPDNFAGQIHAKDGFLAGIGLGATPRPEFTFEARYNYQDSEIFFKPSAGGGNTTVTGLALHQITGNFIFSKLGRTPTVWPYFVLGMGATIFDPGAGYNSQTRFTWSLGLGVKKWIKETTGVRFEGQYNPTYITEDVDGYWCDPFYGCYTSADAHYLDQWQFTLGFVKKLGYH